MTSSFEAQKQSAHLSALLKNFLWTLWDFLYPTHKDLRIFKRVIFSLDFENELRFDKKCAIKPDSAISILRKFGIFCAELAIFSRLNCLKTGMQIVFFVKILSL